MIFKSTQQTERFCSGYPPTQYKPPNSWHPPHTRRGMWFGFGGGSSDDDGFDDDGFFSFASGDGPSTSRARYTSYARKSSAAERRESQGRSKFCDIQNEVEEEGVSTGKRANAAAMATLRPPTHLASPRPYDHPTRVRARRWAWPLPTFDEKYLPSNPNLSAGVRETRNLLDPSCHLTSASWSDFSKWIRSHPGWMAKRRVASEEEKKASKETRQGKVTNSNTNTNTNTRMPAPSTVLMPAPHRTAPHRIAPHRPLCAFVF